MFFVGGHKLLQEPWGIATLCDTYFAFFYNFISGCSIKSVDGSSRIIWLVLIVLLGNIAMASLRALGS